MRRIGRGNTGDRQLPPAQRHALARTLPILLTAACLLLATVGTGASSTPISPTSATTSSIGPRVVDGKLTLGGQPFLPRGFNMIGLLAPAWCKKGQGPLAAAHFGQEELDAAKQWNANTLRFQVSQRGLADPAISTTDREAYLDRVVEGVRLARQQGFVVIVSMQDQSNGCGALHPLPSDLTVAAWDVIAPPLMGDPGVMFELFNEPNVPDTPAGWAQWAGGGTGPTTNLDAAAVGHQALVDNMRALGVTNILIADGAKKAARLGGLTPLTDPIDQLMYGIHPYSYTPGLAYWDQQYASATTIAPVIATEWYFPGDECGTVKPALAKTFLPYLRDHDIGMLAHAFDVPGTTVTNDWAWTPTDCAGATGGSGKLTRDYFAGQSDPDPDPLPGAVSGLAAVAVGPSEVHLSWPAASDTTDHYQVLRDGTALATTTDPTYDDTGLSASSTYSYQVQGVDAQGRAGPVSESVAVTTPAEPDLQPPTAPGAFQVDDVSPSRVGLSWQASSDDTGVVEYQVQRDGATIGHTAELTFGDTTVDPGGAYSYTVVAVDAAGNVSPSSDSALVNVPTVDTTPPTVPTGLVASWSATSGVSLSWDANSTDDTGVTGYVVERDGGAIGSPTGVAFSDIGPLQPGSSHTYVVRAFDAAGNISERSSPAVVVLPAPPDTTRPSVPTRLSAVVLGPTKSRLTWTASSDDTAVTGYRVTRDGVRIATAASTSFVDSAMPANAKHVYRVAAVDAAGNASAVSAAANVTAPAPAPNGLTGKYYDTAAFGSLKLTRVDPVLNFSWGAAAPVAGMGADTFSMRWTGNLLAMSAETYTFYLQSDEGARLWVNGRLLVDDWALHSLREKKATIALTPTQAYTIKVELRENTGNAALRLSWSTPTIAKAVIPTAQLLSK